MELTVVTNTELGWDCVVAVYENASEKDLKYMYPSDEYVFTSTSISEIEKPPVVDQEFVREVEEGDDEYDRSMECIIDNLEITYDNQNILYSKVGANINTQDCHILAKMFVEWLRENEYPTYGGEVVVVKCTNYSYVGMKFPTEKDLNAFNHNVEWMDDFYEDYLKNKKGIELF